MRRFRLFSCGAAPVLALAAVAFAAPVRAEIGITSATAGSPLGKPPTASERVLHVGIDMNANELVTTAADDRAHLVFLDGTALTVGPNSSVVLDKFVYDADKKSGQLGLKAAKGVFRLVGGNISKTNDIEINTPSASMGIRGGIIEFEIAPNGSTKATFLYGTAMKVVAQGITRVATRIGSEIHVDIGQPPSPPTIIGATGGSSSSLFEKSTASVVGLGVAAQAQAQPTENSPPPSAPPSAPPTTTTASIEAALDQSGLPSSNSGGDGSSTGDRRNNIHAADRSNPFSDNAGKFASPLSITTVLKGQTIANRAVVQQNAVRSNNGNGNGNGNGGANNPCGGNCRGGRNH